jgi:hypothetical protein
MRLQGRKTHQVCPPQDSESLFSAKLVRDDYLAPVEVWTTIVSRFVTDQVVIWIYDLRAIGRSGGVMIMIDTFCDWVTERDGTLHEDGFPLELIDQRNAERYKTFFCSDVVTFEVIGSSAEFRDEGI